MTNSKVSIVMVTHQCDFAPRMHFAGQTIGKAVELRVIISYCALVYANPQCACFPNFLIFVG